MLQIILSFLYGILVNLVDDIYDMNILSNYKLFFEGLLLLLTIYIIFFTSDLGLITSVIIAFSAIVGVTVAPSIIKERMWKLTIILGIIGIFYHFQSMKDHWNNVLTLNYKKILMFLIPFILIGTIFSLVEDKLVPEEFGKRKIIDRIIQIIVMTLIIANISKIEKFVEYNQFFKNSILWAATSWLGYVLCSLVIILYFNNKLKK